MTRPVWDGPTTRDLKTYWWKDSNGKWHYHRGTGTPPSNAVETSSTKPEGATVVGQLPPKDSATTSVKPRGPEGREVDPGFYRKPPKPGVNVGPYKDSGVTKKPMTPSQIATKVAGPNIPYKSDAVKKKSEAARSGKGGTVKQEPGKSQGRGLNAVNRGEGSRKVYDDARARLLKKKKGSQSYRP